MNIALIGNSSSVQFGHENLLLGKQQVNDENTGISCIVPVQRKISDRHVSVINMIDLHEGEHVDQLVGQLVKETEIQAFVFIVRLGQFTDADKMGLEWLQRVFGDRVLQFVLILFTYETEGERDSIIDDLKKNPVLEQLVEKCGGRYHTCSKIMNNQSEIRELMDKIEHLTNENQQQRYTGEMYNTELQHRDGLEKNKDCESALDLERLTRRIPTRDEQAVSSLPLRRIVLLGKTGVGKSAVGNTILGQKEFRSVMRMVSVTHVCSAAQATVSGRSVSVVDTPGFFDTKMKPEQLLEELARSVYISSPGPHAFLIVFPVNVRFTEQEQQIPQKIEKIFGQEVLKYSIILFTHGDLLEGKTLEELIEENCTVTSVVQQCGGRYHVFNNKHVNNRQQVEDLLQKIDSMIQQNGGAHYSNQMYEDAQRFRQEEEEERLRDEERKLQEEKQRQEEIERVKKEAKRIIAEINAKRDELERLERERKEEDERKLQEETKRQDEIEMKRKEIEKNKENEVSFKAELERLERERKDKDERKLQEETKRQEEIETKRKEIEKNREKEVSCKAELERLEGLEKKRMEEKRKQQDTSKRGFIEFYKNYRHYFLVVATGTSLVSFFTVGAALAAGVIATAGVAETVHKFINFGTASKKDQGGDDDKQQKKTQ